MEVESFPLPSSTPTSSSSSSSSSVGAGATGALNSTTNNFSKIFEEQVVLPGDDLTSYIAQVVEREAEAAAAATGSGSSSSNASSTATSIPIRLGAGLYQEHGSILCTKAGILAYRKPGRFYVLTNQRRYVPAIGDTVVGIIVDRTTDFYRVRLHGTSTAQLPLLAFDGASKRNKPNLVSGTVIFARVAAVSKHMEPELSCQGEKRQEREREGGFVLLLLLRW